MKLTARLFAALAFFSIFLTQLTPFAFAQTTNPYSVLMKTDASTPINISTIAQGALMGILSSLTCALTGIDPTSQNNQCLTFNTKTQTFSYAPVANSGGLIGMGLGGIAFTYQNPIHVGDYFQYLSSDFGLVKTAHAASNGIGFDQLTPIMTLWIALRNLSYFVFVLVFVVIGFAVMLRAKIDPRTVMTIENQIPKLIVALVLISFSYAIAGFVIDIMWVGIYFVINMFATLDPTLAKEAGPLTSSVTSNPFAWVNALNTGPFGFIGIAQQAAGGIKDISTAIIANIFSMMGSFKFLFFTILDVPALISCMFQGLIPGAFDTCINNGMAAIPAFLAGLVAFLIFALALLVAIAKLWWKLTKAYALFLIFTIFGPVIIMSGVIPGWTKTNFEYWLRHILAYSIVFPTAMGVFLLGKTLMDVYSSSSTANLTAPPLIGITSGAYAFFGPLLGFAIIMLAPQSLEMVQDALNAPDPKYLGQVAANIGAGASLLSSTVNKGIERSWHPRNVQTGMDEGWLRSLALGNPENSGRGLRGNLRRFIEGTRTGSK